jgi:hypothetical protein
VPWCATCEHFYNPNSLRPDGSCPGCEEVLGEPIAPIVDSVPKAPWHFKVLVVATVAYLAWRLVQGLGWAAGAL